MSGLILFLIVSFSFSLQSVTITSILCTIIYFIAGFILYRTINDSFSFIIFFLPHFIPFIILFSNRELFPEIVPLISINAIVSFLIGYFIRFNLGKNQIVIIFLLGLLISYGLIINLLLIPRLLLNKSLLNENSKIDYQDVQFYDQNSKKLKLSENGIEVLNFWFVGCGTCYPHNSMLNEIANNFKSEEVKFYLIDMGSVDSFEKFAGLRNRWKNLYYLYDSAGKATSQFKIAGAPHTLILKSGRVIHEHTGFSKEIEYLLKDEIISTIRSNLSTHD